MIRVHRALACLILLGLSLTLDPTPIRAARSPAISTTTRVEYDFAQVMTFFLTATSDTRIYGAKVFYQAEGTPLLQADATFEPGLSIEAQVSVELRGGVFPPFSKVTYWWEIASDDRPVWPVPRQTVDYYDDRFTWQRISNGGVTVQWAEGDRAFAESILGTALEALPGLTAEIGVTPPSNIDVYVYPSLDDLKTALRLGGREWAGGQARPELGVVLVDVPPTPTALVQMRRAIPHELAHLLVYAAAQPGYDHVPAWLNEGLATANEASPDPAQAVALETAVRAGTLLSFESLCAPFPADANQAQLAYAQSGDVVQFIRNRYGGQGIRNLLAAYRENATCAAGVQRALGVSLPVLEDEWRAQFGLGGGAVSAVTQTSVPWVVLLVVIGLALLPMVMGLPASRRKT